MSSFTDYNVTYGCYDMSTLCTISGGDSHHRELAGDDATDDGGAVESPPAESAAVTTANYGAMLAAILATLLAILSQNPFAINPAHAVLVSKNEEFLKILV